MAEGRLSKLEEMTRSAHKRLDKIEEMQTEIQNLAISVNDLAHSIKDLCSDMSDVTSRLKVIEQKPGKHWDNLVSVVLASIASGLIGYMISCII